MPNQFLQRNIRRVVGCLGLSHEGERAPGRGGTTHANFLEEAGGGRRLNPKGSDFLFRRSRGPRGWGREFLLHVEKKHPLPGDPMLEPLAEQPNSEHLTPLARRPVRPSATFPAPAPAPQSPCT